MVESFWEHATSLEAVTDVYHIAGANDFMLRVVVRDAEDLRNLVLDAFTQWPEVTHVETALIFEHRRNPTVPIYHDEA